MPSRSSSVDEILGRDVPGRVRREGAAAEPADRGVEHGRARLERGERVRVPRVARVVEVAADRAPELPHAARRATARRSGRRRRSCRRGRARPGRGVERPVSRSSRTCLGSTSPSNGQPNATLSVTVERRPSARARDDDPRRGRERLVDARSLVSLVERLGHAECEPHLVETGRGEPLVAALVQREAGANDARRARRRRRRPPPRLPSAGRGVGRRSSRPRSPAGRPRRVVARARRASRRRGPRARSAGRRADRRRTGSHAARSWPRPPYSHRCGGRLAGMSQADRRRGRRLGRLARGAALGGRGGASALCAARRGVRVVVHPAAADRRSGTARGARRRLPGSAGGRARRRNRRARGRGCRRLAARAGVDGRAEARRGRRRRGARRGERVGAARRGGSHGRCGLQAALLGSVSRHVTTMRPARSSWSRASS